MALGSIVKTTVSPDLPSVTEGCAHVEVPDIRQSPELVTTISSVPPSKSSEIKSFEREMLSPFGPLSESLSEQPHRPDTMHTIANNIFFIEIIRF